MTRQPVNIEDVTLRAQQLVDDRMEAVREYAAAVNDVTVARQTLETAERGQRAAWRMCLKSGWTERQLAATGLPKPPQGPGRPRRTPAPEENFREPGISTGEGVLDAPEPEAGDPVVEQLDAKQPDVDDPGVPSESDGDNPRVAL